MAVLGGVVTGLRSTTALLVRFAQVCEAEPACVAFNHSGYLFSIRESGTSLDNTVVSACIDSNLTESVYSILVWGESLLHMGWKLHCSIMY